MSATISSNANTYNAYIGIPPVGNSGTLAYKDDISLSADNVLSKTASYTIVAGDFFTGKKSTLDLSVDATSGAVTITLPSGSTYVGYTIYVTKTDASANAVTISGLSGSNTLTTQGQTREMKYNGTTWSNR